ncbi:MAG: DUF3299 domain-containing protein [Pseudomonadota bacterium]
MSFTRRGFLSNTAFASLVGLPAVASAATPVELSWSDLASKAGALDIAKLGLLRIVQHGEMTHAFDLELGSQVTKAYNGQLVRIPGFLLPLDFDGAYVKTGLLVPYVGACIHVPPPPPNQLILVTLKTRYASSQLFAPVYATGVFQTATAEKQFTEVGYVLTAHTVAAYP